MCVKLSHLEHERPVLFHELIPGSSASSSDIEESDADSMPELEDETKLGFGRNPFVANTQWVYGNLPRRKGDF